MFANGFAANKDSLLYSRYTDSLLEYESNDIEKTSKFIALIRKLNPNKAKAKDVVAFNFVLADYYFYSGQPDSALIISMRALEIAKKNKDKTLIGNAYSNLATIYGYSGDNRNEVRFYRESLNYTPINEKTATLGNRLFNLCLAYRDLKMNDSSNYYLDKAYKLFLDIDYPSGLGSCYGVYAIKAKHENKPLIAEKYHLLQLNIFRRLNEKDRLIIPYENIGTLYIDMGKYELAKKYIDSAFFLAKELNSFEDIYNIYYTYSQYFLYTNNYKEAYDYLHQYYLIRDSVFDSDYKSDMKSVTAIYEKEKSNLEIKVQKLESENLQKSKFYIQVILVIAVIGFVLIIGFLFFRQRAKQKAFNHLMLLKNQITHQKETIEEKQKEIIDSINYAQRLQNAILAKPEEIDNCLKENFLLYLPKDIVAGDFYFFETTPTHLFYAAADCTGHGVPGAMVSIVCSNALTRCVKEFDLTDPGKILDKTRELILDTFKKSGQDVKDGMDISLISIEKNTSKILWAGANNPLWYLHNNSMIEIKPDKQPIGKSDNPKPFTSHELPFNKDVTLYLFTDGYADQFGGEKGKKFKYSNLQKLLLQLADCDMKEQSKLLVESFERWKGNLEQVDDVCIIGVKL